MDSAELSVLKAEIEDQMSTIDAIIQKVENRKHEYTERPEFTESLAYQFHNLYCAFEDLLRIVAKFFENSIDDSSRYHIELLRRMRLNIEGVRPPLISSELCAVLDEFRAFRHVFRHAYSYDLDPQKLGLLLEKLELIKKHYPIDIHTFITRLETGNPHE